ncbi:acetyl-CoA carboxylase 1-like [Spinacia oleracea]|uniref:Acetyl-CoA carboxylase 1-like n=1 Tax=Spinacia oleracea TaxID=3562 RepID=A0A9R0HYU7_SPIOL|nr:acetyl-CoA carboxylase 1-like [Spinacia oleracea]
MEESLIKTARNAVGEGLTHKLICYGNGLVEGQSCYYEKKLTELRVQKVLNQLSNIGNSSSDLRALPHGLASLIEKEELASSFQIVTDNHGLVEEVQPGYFPTRRDVKP